MALPKINRLPLRFERDRINKEGQPYSGQFFTLVVSKNQNSQIPRMAILVSKKISILAVDRNLLRRRVSTIIQKLLPKIHKADYLIIPKKNSLSALINDLESDLTKLFNV